MFFLLLPKLSAGAFRQTGNSYSPDFTGRIPLFHLPKGFFRPEPLFLHHRQHKGVIQLFIDEFWLLAY
jgi:hypothetical protein